MISSEEKLNSKKIKVLFIGGYPTTDNPNRNIFNQRSLKILSGKADITVINIRNWLPFKRFISKRADEKIEVIEYRFPNYPFHTKYIISLNCFLIGIFMSIVFKNELKNIDIIHSAGASFFGIVGGLISKKNHIPHIAQLIGSDINSDFRRLKSSWLYKSFNRRVNAVGANSDELRKEYLKLFPETKNIRTIYRGISIKNESNAKKFDSQKFHFLFLGGMSKYSELEYKINTKGCITLMNAWKFIEDDISLKDCYLYFGGPSSDCEEFHKWRNSLKYPERVILIGQIKNDDTFNYYKISDITIIPSMEEGMPNVALESMSMGTPLIGSDAGGLPEIIENDKNGYIFNKNNFNELAEKMIYVIKNKNKLTELSNNAFNTIKMKFNSSNFANQYIDLYKEVLRSDN